MRNTRSRDRHGVAQVVTTVALTRDLDDRLRDFADRNDSSVSRIVREALEKFLAAETAAA